MGAHSTIDVSRTRARYLISMFAQVATDEDLGNMMSVMLYDRLYNCRVVDVGPNDELAMECLGRYVEDKETAEEER